MRACHEIPPRDVFNLKMCMTIPGKIISISDNVARVKILEEEYTAKIIDGNYKVGEYVFIQHELVVQKIPEKEALKAIEIWKTFK